MKYQYQGVINESKVQSNWDNIGDTDLEHIDIQNFKERVYAPNAYGKPKRMVESDIAQAVGFPPAIQNYELCGQGCKTVSARNQNGGSKGNGNG